MQGIELHFSDGLTNDAGWGGEETGIGLCTALGKTELLPAAEWEKRDELTYVCTDAVGGTCHKWVGTRYMPVNGSGTVEYGFVVNGSDPLSSSGVVSVEISAEYKAVGHDGAVLDRTSCYRNNGIHVNDHMTGLPDSEDGGMGTTDGEDRKAERVFLLGTKLLMDTSRSVLGPVESNDSVTRKCYEYEFMSGGRKYSGWKWMIECVDVDAGNGAGYVLTYAGAENMVAWLGVERYTMEWPHSWKRVSHSVYAAKWEPAREYVALDEACRVDGTVQSVRGDSGGVCMQNSVLELRQGNASGLTVHAADVKNALDWRLVRSWKG